MKNKLNELKLTEIILGNIRRLRNTKDISSKEMAYAVGMKPPEYSKLERGHKLNWEKWIDKIAAALGVEKYDLMINESEKTSTIWMNPEMVKIIDEERAIHLQLFKALDEKDKVKDALIKDKEEKIVDLKLSVTYWADKYKRLKSKLIGVENQMAQFIKKSFRINKSKSATSLGNVGGGLIDKFSNLCLS